MTKVILCMLRKGSRNKLRWVPKQYAEIGRYLKIKINDKWDHDWQIIDLGREKEGKSEVQQKNTFWKVFLSWF